MDSKSPLRSPRARTLASGASASDVHMHLFVVERRLPSITERGLAMLQAALTEASARFGARGEQVLYLRSIFVPGQERLISLFSATSIDLVRAANEASLVPYVGIQPALDLHDPGEPYAEL